MKDKDSVFVSGERRTHSIEQGDDVVDPETLRVRADNLKREIEDAGREAAEQRQRADEAGWGPLSDG